MKRFSRKSLKEYRRAHGLTQDQLAALVGVKDKNTVYRWEVGLRAVPKWVGTLLLEVLEPRQRKGKP